MSEPQSKRSRMSTERAIAEGNQELKLHQSTVWDVFWLADSYKVRCQCPIQITLLLRSHTTSNILLARHLCTRTSSLGAVCSTKCASSACSTFSSAGSSDLSYAPTTSWQVSLARRDKIRIFSTGSRRVLRGAL